MTVNDTAMDCDCDCDSDSDSTAFLPSQVSVLCVIAVLVNLCHLSPWGMPIWLKVPIIPFELTAPSLGLLLVFRTNTSFGRWAEGRRLFGRSLNRCHDICRQGLTCFPDKPALKAQLLRYMKAFPYTLKV